MSRGSYRVNVRLEREHAEKLARLAARTRTQEEALAGSPLARALDDVDADADEIAETLDAIPGAYERAQHGLDQARLRQTVRLEDL